MMFITKFSNYHIFKFRKRDFTSKQVPQVNFGLLWSLCKVLTASWFTHVVYHIFFTYLLWKLIFLSKYLKVALIPMMQRFTSSIVEIKKLRKSRAERNYELIATDEDDGDTSKRESAFLKNYYISMNEIASSRLLPNLHRVTAKCFHLKTWFVRSWSFSAANDTCWAFEFVYETVTTFETTSKTKFSHILKIAKRFYWVQFFLFTRMHFPS